MMVSFKVTDEEGSKILRLACRAAKLARTHGLKYPMLDAEMDLTACHANGTPLDLNKLAGFDDANFGHDVFGIRRRINRENGKLEGGFLPRCVVLEKQ